MLSYFANCSSMTTGLSADINSERDTDPHTPKDRGETGGTRTDDGTTITECPPQHTTDARTSGIRIHIPKISSITATTREDTTTINIPTIIITMNPGNFIRFHSESIALFFS